jgi:hypothetical protein
MYGRFECVRFHGPNRVGKDLLLHETDARPASESDIPGVGRFEAGRYAQQGGLAHSVRPYEADPIAVCEAERDIAEDKPLAEALRDRLDRKDAHSSMFAHAGQS